jgi:hypothetical protein
MDTSEGALKNATKLIQGKNYRSSGERVQIKLSDKVMMEEIQKNPELMKIYQDHQYQERPMLPNQMEFVEYLRSQTSVKELSQQISVKKTTIEHWFRRDKVGFAYPSIEDWEMIKKHLKVIKFDKEMTTLTNKEWKTLPTPTSRDWKDAGPNVNYKKAKEKGRLAGHSGGSLNPTWVEWLMGYPKGWTDLNH